MGMTISKLRSHPYICSRDLKVTMLGLDSSGKTTILYRLHTGRLITTIPSIGFNVETIVTPRGDYFNLWDVAGQSLPLWRHYIENNVAIVFVVDSTNHDRIAEAKEALWQIFIQYEEELRYTSVLLVYANKQDQANAMTVEEVKDALDIDNLPGFTENEGSRRKRWHIQGSSTLSDDGLWEGMEWISTQLRGVE